MRNVMLAVDAGGTNFKYALMDADGALLSECLQIPVNEKGTAQEIEASWRAMAESARELAVKAGAAVERVCVSTPGPFDFAGGMSRMKHKFPAIFGLPIRPWLQDALPGVPVDFLHDSTAFILGEARPEFRSPACVMLGTGFGFACMREGRVLVNESRTPAVILWNHPFRGGIVEDTISRRALRAAYAEKTGTDGSLDVKEIADACRAGDPAAKAVFDGLSDALAELLAPILEKLGSDALILGGQISRSADLFMPGLLAKLPCPVALSEHPDSAALVGCARFAALGGAQGAEQPTAEALI